MLSFQTVLPDTLELLKVLMQIPELTNTRLVGDTSLALQYGHRRSVDLDFFGYTTEDADSQPMPYMFENIDWETIKQHIRFEVEKYNKSLNKI